MDKRPFSPKVIAIVAIALVVCSLSFWLPGATRVGTVASMGVGTANMIGGIATTVGFVAAVIAVALVIYSAIQANALNRAAAQKALEAKQWSTLPPKDETNPDVLEPMLRRIAMRYPKANPLLEITLEQLDDIRQSLAKISHIFQINAGIISDDPRFASCELLIQKVLQEIGPGLVRIVYQAYEPDNSDTSVPALIKVVNDVNDENQPRVAATSNLANNVVFASTQGNTESVLAQVKEAADKLTKKEEGWL